MAFAQLELPGWLLAGIGLGALLTVLIAITFALGARVFPDTPSGSNGESDGEHRRRAEIRGYLRSIGEEFVEEYPVGGRTVAFYLPTRKVAVTFDARTYFVLEREGIRAVLVEHELPGSGLGGRLPFETPDPVGRGVYDGGDAAFSTLGLPPTASREDVKRAYRKRLKEVHPDHGGDVEAFERVRQAYTVASERAN